MRTVYTFAVLMASLVALVNSYPDGYGVDSACSSMTPNHGVSSMNSASPYYVDVNHAYYQPGQGVQVTIGSFNSTFKGFMIQARRANNLEDQTEMLGNFTVVSDTHSVCYGHALVHSNSYDKKNLTLNWNSPSNSSGDIVFRVTFVQSEYVFWTNVESERVYDVVGMQTSTMHHREPTLNPKSTFGNPAPSTTMTTTSGPRVIYKDDYCGRYMGCFTDCNVYGCGFSVSWYVSAPYVAYTLKSSYPAPGFYMAIGFSNDNEMGDDSVMGCVYQNGQVYTFTGENVGHQGPTLFSDDQVQLYGNSYSNDIFTCIILRPIAGLGKRADLNNTWTLFFAKGVAHVVNGDITLYQHGKDVYISNSKASAYSVVDLQPTWGDTDDDDVNANSADSLMQTGSMKVLSIFTFAIMYYLAKLRF